MDSFQVEWELFPGYDPENPSTKQAILERVSNFQKANLGKCIHRMFEADNLGKSKIAMNTGYQEAKKFFAAGVSLFDGGCGFGSDLRRAILDSADPKAAIGMTWDPREIEWGFELYGDKGMPLHSGSYIVGDLRSIPLPERSIDIAFSRSVIHTMPTKADASQYLKEIRRILRPPVGIFFGSTGGCKSEHDNKEIMRYATSQESLKELLESLGFRQVEVSASTSKQKAVFGTTSNPGSRDVFDMHINFFARL